MRGTMRLLLMLLVVCGMLLCGSIAVFAQRHVTGARRAPGGGSPLQQLNPAAQQKWVNGMKARHAGEGAAPQHTPVQMKQQISRARQFIRKSHVEVPGYPFQLFQPVDLVPAQVDARGFATSFTTDLTMHMQPTQAENEGEHNQQEPQVKQYVQPALQDQLISTKLEAGAILHRLSKHKAATEQALQATNGRIDLSNWCEENSVRERNMVDFLHIPKTGGMSVAGVMRDIYRQYCGYRPYARPDNPDNKPPLPMTLECKEHPYCSVKFEEQQVPPRLDLTFASNRLVETLKGSRARIFKFYTPYSILLGHTDISVPVEFASVHKHVHILTFVRDPIKRFDSLYNFLTNENTLEDMTACSDHTSRGVLEIHERMMQVLVSMMPIVNFWGSRPGVTSTAGAVGHIMSLSQLEALEDAFDAAFEIQGRVATRARVPRVSVYEDQQREALAPLTLKLAKAAEAMGTAATSSDVSTKPPPISISEREAFLNDPAIQKRIERLKEWQQLNPLVGNCSMFALQRMRRYKLENVEHARSWIHQKMDFGISKKSLLVDSVDASAVSHAEFIDVLKEINQLNYMVHAYSGTSPFSLWGDASDIEPSELLELAKLGLESCSFVGYTESFERSLDMLVHVLGFNDNLRGNSHFQRKQYVRGHAARKRNDGVFKAGKHRRPLPADVIERLENEMKPDRELYQFAVELFENRYKQIPHLD